jgi:hypothetical protein
MLEDKRYSIRYETLLDAEIKTHKIPYIHIPCVIRNYSYDGLNFISEDFNPKPKEILELKIKHSVKDTISHVVGEIVWYKHVNTRCYVGLKIKKIDEKL